jgi:orotate phosphoribosyltransferase
MPLTFGTAFLERIGSLIWEQIPIGRPVHLVALASGGISMAIAAAVTDPGMRLRSVTIVKRAFDFDSPQLCPDVEDAVAILDNTLHSGRSVTMSIRQLTKRGITPECVITLFDAANDCEREARSRIEKSAGVPLRSCAAWADRHEWGSRPDLP